MARPSARHRRDEATVAAFERLVVPKGFIACPCHARVYAWDSWQHKPSIKSRRRHA